MTTQNTTQLKEEYIITSLAFDRMTGKPIGTSREEEINIKTNFSFRNVQTILDVKETYERFWNELNDTSEHIVFVSSVREKRERSIDGSTEEDCHCGGWDNDCSDCDGTGCLG